MQLFYSPPSPFARKVRIVAREQGLMDRIEEISVNPFQDDARLLAVNPAGFVPALIGEGGSALIDSPLICRYLEGLSSQPAHMANKSTERTRVLQHAALADAIIDLAVTVTIERRKADTAPSPAFIDRRLGQMTRCIESLPHPHTSTPTDITMGDIATACALAYLDFRHSDLAWRSMRPDLADWHTMIEQRPAFVETQPAEYVG